MDFSSLLGPGPSQIECSRLATELYVWLTRNLKKALPGILEVDMAFGAGSTNQDYRGLPNLFTVVLLNSFGFSFFDME
ncbi:hypothetical protein E2562_033928, partial [Oryza meyeriana var. granulata]